MLTYEVVASDPQGSALTFSWEANVGTLGTPDTSDSRSRITWKAPSCVSASTFPVITATVTNAFGLTDTRTFKVKGLPACDTSGWAPTGSMAEARVGHTATLLLNGKVLVAGGGSTSTAELYTPAPRGIHLQDPLHGPRMLPPRPPCAGATAAAVSVACSPPSCPSA